MYDKVQRKDGSRCVLGPVWQAPVATDFAIFLMFHVSVCQKYTGNDGGTHLVPSFVADQYCVLPSINARLSCSQPSEALSDRSYKYHAFRTASIRVSRLPCKRTEISAESGVADDRCKGEQIDDEIIPPTIDAVCIAAFSQDRFLDRVNPEKCLVLSVEWLCDNPLASTKSEYSYSAIGGMNAES